MGPRQKSLGNCNRRVRRSNHKRLQWGRGKKASEMGIVIAFSYKLSRFNGAEAKKPRKLYLGDAKLRYCANASMGPRQKSLGNADWDTLFRRLLFASMGPRQKSLGNNRKYSRKSISNVCFNGAEAKKPRKSDALVVDDIYDSGLQWGRGKKASEMWPALA